MFVLALIFCLKADSAVCKPVVYPNIEPTFLTVCQRFGQMVAEEALRTRLDLQDYRLARVLCQPAKKPHERDL